MARPTEIGIALRAARNERGWSQTQLSMKTSTHPHVTSISDWERGANTPTTRHLVALAAALDKPLDYFTPARSAPLDTFTDLTAALMRAVDERLAAVAH